jgi:polyisoprenoid-binding protein YceI
METSTPKKRAGMARWKKLALGGTLVVVALGALGVWWFLRDDAPKAVSLDAAVSGVSSGSAPSSGGVAGNWTVDTSVGTFSFEDSTGTFVGFRVAEQLSGIGSATAVGRTPAVSGTMTIDGTQLTATSITADMTALTTNNSRRDGPAREALGTSQFPNATFVLTKPIDLGAAAGTGAKTSVTATGDLTVKGVTKSVQFPLQAQLTGNTIVVVGSLDVVFSDFGITAPTAPIVLSVEDHGQIELQLFFTRA